MCLLKLGPFLAIDSVLVWVSQMVPVVKNRHAIAEDVKRCEFDLSPLTLFMIEMQFSSFTEPIFVNLPAH